MACKLYASSIHLISAWLSGTGGLPTEQPLVLVKQKPPTVYSGHPVPAIRTAQFLPCIDCRPMSPAPGTPSSGTQLHDGPEATRAWDDKKVCASLLFFLFF